MGIDEISPKSYVVGKEPGYFHLSIEKSGYDIDQGVCTYQHRILGPIQRDLKISNVRA